MSYEPTAIERIRKALELGAATHASDPAVSAQFEAALHALDEVERELSGPPTTPSPPGYPEARH